MKITTILLTLCIMQASATGFAQKITIKQKDITIDQFFSEISRQTGYNVFYSDKKIDQNLKIDVNFKNTPLEEALSMSLKFSSIKFSIVDKNILLERRESTLLGKLVDVFVNIQVKGIVVDEEGLPLPGATIKIKNGNATAITGKNGDFSIPNIDENATLVVSYIGYESKEIKVTSESMVIKLIQNKSKLDEVVVQAYGTTTRKLNTGNIGKISATDIANQPVSNPLGALDGRIAGMVVTQGNGLPGSAFKVEIRGRTAIDRTLTDDQPLFVIDGIPVAANNAALNKQSSALGNPSSLTALGGISPFSSINPQDIESIEVLKDADATAIYGSRGANGVVIITTKKGKAGKTKVDFNTYAGINQVAKTIPMLNTQQYVAMRKQAFKNDGVNPASPDADAYDFMVWDTTRYTDFNKLLGRNTAHSNDANLSLSGGNENTQFLIGGNYHRESTVLGGDLADKRASTHFNINHSSPNQKFKIIFSGNYSTDNNNLIVSDLSSYYNLPPNLKLYEPDGSLAWNEGGYVTSGPLSNPLGILNKSYQAKTNSLTGNLQISYAILKDLTLKANLGYNTVQNDETTLYPRSASNPALTAPNTSYFNNNQFLSRIAEPQIEYKKQFSKHKLNILLGGSLQATDNNGTGINAAGYANEALMNSLTGYTSLTATKFITQYRYEAIFGRVNYNWEDTYLLNLTARRDGSSRFGPDKQFANFGSAGAAWIFSNNALIKDKLTWFSFGKLRASYGVTGNDKISNYQYLDTWKSTTNTYNSSPGFFPTKLFNPDYHWERTNKLEAGLELGFIKDRILMTASYYNNSSSNQLINYKLPNVTGFTSVVANFPAKVVNSGLELTLTTTNVDSKDFSWTTSANLTIPKNKIVSFPGLQNSSYKTIYVEGESLNLIYKYKYLGVDAQTGLSTFEDKNSDGTLNVDDRQLAGNTDPKFYGGIQNSVRYKRFQLDFFLSFRKQTGLTYLASIYTAPGMIGNFPTKMTDFWTTPGVPAQFQKLSQDYGPAYTAWNNLISNSNAVYGDASFLRLKNISFSYALPENWLGKLHINNARIYLQGQNLLTFSGYELGDPETQTLNSTPPLRIVVAGLSFNL